MNNFKAYICVTATQIKKYNVTMALEDLSLSFHSPFLPFRDNFKSDHLLDFLYAFAMILLLFST